MNDSNKDKNLTYSYGTIPPEASDWLSIGFYLVSIVQALIIGICIGVLK